MVAEDEGPVRLRRRPLTAAQRWRTAAVAAAPILIGVLVLMPFALAGPATVVEALVAAAVYGGLLGLAAGFVYVDRTQARQCPRCGRGTGRRELACRDCDYDLETAPRYACPERHEVYVEPGLCACGLRLQRLEPARGIGREITVILKAGAWLLAFLIGVGVLLRVLS